MAYARDLPLFPVCLSRAVHFTLTYDLEIPRIVALRESDRKLSLSGRDPKERSGRLVPNQATFAISLITARIFSQETLF